ncbi:4-hydroxyphenylacetate isomerase [Pokkaliibacter plantistimulans]|uniref:4-hydroxyphenylacetate isomerase n=1 Tax=Proteobacteria bacterium 228 TaxID=2083153 RepID=A0A2S5KWR0_9PROT|nr:fumarylacetoacetate hydrolase family protein [Pokkaliibacter plantistimulans]PPC79210.1 4-hydroxyphenylacetate isomerase [Pokkaliibacter plantistimulans]
MKRGHILLDGQDWEIIQHTELPPGPEANKLPWTLPITGTVIGVALNTTSILASLEGQLDKAPYKEAPKTPVLFIKTANTHVKSGQEVAIPLDQPSFAGPALGVLIGKVASKVREEDALEVIAGYTLVNEISLEEKSFYRPDIKGKCRDTFCPIGTLITDTSDIADPSALTIDVSVNGVLQQQYRTSELIYSIPQLIARISAFMTLQPGDLLITGTPLKQVRLQNGDIISLHCKELGSLENPVVATINHETGAEIGQ